MFKKSLTRLLALALILTTLCSLFAFGASAATSAYNVLSASTYAKVYTLSASGTTIPYTSKTLSTRGSVTNGQSKTAYIDNKTDELYLCGVGTYNGKTWAYVSYPTSSRRLYAYIPLSAISQNNANHAAKTSSGKFYCSARITSGRSTSYYVDPGDRVYLLATNGTKYQILYPVSGGKYRIAFCDKTDYIKYCDPAPQPQKYTGYVNTSSSDLLLRSSPSTNSSVLASMPKGASLTVLDNKAKTNGFYHVTYGSKTGYAYASYITFTKPEPVSFNPLWPCRNARYISTMYRYWNSGNPKNHGVRTNIYNAFDVAGSYGDTIYAVEKGVVAEKGYQGSGFGYYVVIDHGNGLYSLYGHMKSASCVNKGQSVQRGQTIGYMGSTGNSSGTHLHFEMFNPNNKNTVINPWVTYYQGKISVTVGGNSYKANSRYTNDSAAMAWCRWLTNNCRKNANGDYVFG